MTDSRHDYHFRYHHNQRIAISMPITHLQGGLFLHVHVEEGAPDNQPKKKCFKTFDDDAECCDSGTLNSSKRMCDGTLCRDGERKRREKKVKVKVSA